MSDCRCEKCKEVDSSAALTAASERIREIEAERDRWYGKATERAVELTAEREVSDKLADAVADAVVMVEYLHGKFKETGSGNGKIAQWQHLLAEVAAIRAAGK